MNIVLVYLLAIGIGLSSSHPTSDSTSSSRIVNGFAIDISEIPYQASLRRKVTSGWAHSCGAVIITIRAVLTAAHCIYSYESQPSQFRVTVGTSNRQSGGRTYEISTVIPHEEYSSITLQNDIAMLVTSKLISFGKNTKPITFAESGMDLPTGTEALVSGFGVTSYGGSVSSVLQAAVVRVVSQISCVGAYFRIGSITSGMLCATGSDPPRDACQGDSGGPLVSNNRLIGIVSWGEECANTSYPGVYTRVSKYNTWIHKKLLEIY